MKIILSRRIVPKRHALPQPDKEPKKSCHIGKMWQLLSSCISEQPIKKI